MKCKNCGTDFEGRFCPNCGTAIEDYSKNTIYTTQTSSEKNKKPFYKRGWFIVLAIICVLTFFQI